ncbi:MAG: hypothetical protein WAV20_18560 [Blastocatellia bacterium]
MPSLDNLLSQLEEAKRQFGAGNEQRTRKLLEQLSRRRFPDVASVIRFHEALLFIRSHPQGPASMRVADAQLETFGERVAELRSAGADLTPFDYIENSGIAGTTISGSFSFDIVRHLIARYSSHVRADWDRHENPERLGATLPRFVPLLCEDSLVEANVPYLTWLHAATGGKRSRDLGWLVRRFERLMLSEREKAELFDSLEIRTNWELVDSRASRTRNMRRVRTVFYHTAPLIPRSQVLLDNEFQSPPINVKRLSRLQGKAMQAMLRDATTVRYRELYGITLGDPDTVVQADVGRGVQIFLWGLPLERRLPMRAYHAGFALKNGVPINYVEGITICERMEIGFNTFYTFREGESAWVYGRVLRLLNQLVGVTCISIDPYQIGFHNDEAIESGAFWFYRKLGFRPTRPELVRLMKAEEKKIGIDAKYRTPARVLRRLSAGNIVYEAPGSHRGDWDRFQVRKLGLAVNRRMSDQFDGSADRMRSGSLASVSRALGIEPKVSEESRRAVEDLAMVLALIPDLAQWTNEEKRDVARIIEAKTGATESRYARLLQRHTKLRAAIIKIGSGR